MLNATAKDAYGCRLERVSVKCLFFAATTQRASGGRSRLQHDVLFVPCSCSDRLGPRGAEEHRRATISKAEENLLKSLSFTPGGTPKKWDPRGEEYYRFLERQQAAMRKRAILADRHQGEYAPVPGYVGGDSDDEDEDEH